MFCIPPPNALAVSHTFLSSQWCIIDCVLGAILIQRHLVLKAEAYAIETCHWRKIELVTNLFSISSEEKYIVLDLIFGMLYPNVSDDQELIDPLLLVLFRRRDTFFNRDTIPIVFHIAMLFVSIFFLFMMIITLIRNTSIRTLCVVVVCFELVFKCHNCIVLTASLNFLHIISALALYNLYVASWMVFGKMNIRKWNDNVKLNVIDF
ncbi:hypothetical protein T4D_11786 [Trichinella pseudospiralis]|uniref:Uncharacterized protein n=1 Tax=Trichinella pseudospiralis TaxID=6337 RepID=A0A0V1G410_TRIPS|nr:hypothetical protein T4D_11786 [Trichinella pseudospiralis]